MRRTLCLLAVALCLAGPVAAAPAVEHVEASPTQFDPVAHKRVLGISEQLRCLVCQNQSIADSNAELAVDLRNQVIEQIKAGRTDKEIIVMGTSCSLTRLLSSRPLFCGWDRWCSFLQPCWLSM